MPRNGLHRKRGSSVIPLADNFRSREAILEFVNSIFAALMRSEIDGVAYDDERGCDSARAQNETGLDCDPVLPAPPLNLAT